eukprot:UN00624
MVMPLINQSNNKSKRKYNNNDNHDGPRRKRRKLQINSDTTCNINDDISENITDFFENCEQTSDEDWTPESEKKPSKPEPGVKIISGKIEMDNGGIYYLITRWNKYKYITGSWQVQTNLSIDSIDEFN